MTKFRLLQTDYHNAAFNMALDEVLLNRIASGQSAPTLRFYRWQPPAISIGYFQSLESEVDVRKCEELGVDVVRRQTGGGAVFHDDEITYSVHIPLELDFSSGKISQEKILDSYAKICEALIMGLAQLGISAFFAPINDIVVQSPTLKHPETGQAIFQKISGNAQTRKQGILLQHGTIIKSVNVEKMFELLKVPDEKMKGKLISDIKQRVTSIDAFLSAQPAESAATGIATTTSQHLPDFKKIVEALITGFKQAFSSIDFQEDSLTDAEIAEATALASSKYSTKSWNYQR